jgi:hypothetical protein
MVCSPGAQYSSEGTNHAAGWVAGGDDDCDNVIPLASQSASPLSWCEACWRSATATCRGTEKSVPVRSQGVSTQRGNHLAPPHEHRGVVGRDDPVGAAWLAPGVEEVEEGLPLAKSVKRLRSVCRWPRARVAITCTHATAPPLGTVPLSSDEHAAAHSTPWAVKQLLGMFLSSPSARLSSLGLPHAPLVLFPPAAEARPGGRGASVKSHHSSRELKSSGDTRSCQATTKSLSPGSRSLRYRAVKGEHLIRAVHDGLDQAPRVVLGQRRPDLPRALPPGLLAGHIRRLRDVVAVAVAVVRRGGVGGGHACPCTTKKSRFAVPGVFFLYSVFFLYFFFSVVFFLRRFFLRTLHYLYWESFRDSQTTFPTEEWSSPQCSMAFLLPQPSSPSSTASPTLA